MRPTPALPTWIREKTVLGYVNAHALCPRETRLYGTESLYGDWDARVLLLAKDFAPSKYLNEQIAAGAGRPYSHKPKLRTNTRLRRMADPVKHLGILYGSALANLLRDDGEWGDLLPNRSAALEYGARVLSNFVLPNLREDVWIMCLGEEAWECACAATRQVGDWRAYRDQLRPLGNLIPAFHPARVSNERQAGPWELLAELAS